MDNGYYGNGGFDPEEKTAVNKKKQKNGILTYIALALLTAVTASLITLGITLKKVNGNSVPEGDGIGDITINGASDADETKSETEAAAGSETKDVSRAETASEGSEKHKITDIFGSDTSGIKDAKAIYAENIESVVGITAKGKTTNIFGQVTSTASSGTGFVIRSDGYIMTNFHVIDGSEEFTVTFSSGASYPAEVVGYENEISDIAVLKIDAENLRAVTMGSSDTLLVGEDITVIGNPLGELTFSLSKGVVSALGRRINADGTPVTMFQIDAAVNSGNSGGPAFDENGYVVGIVTAKYASEKIEGLGFCIPASDAASVASDIIEYGYVRGRATLGVSCEDAYELYSYYYRYYGNRVNQIKGLLMSGVYVTSVDKNSSSGKAGIRKGDYITAINKTQTDDCDALNELLAKFSPGDTVTVTICREGVYEDLRITLDEFVPAAFGGGSESGSLL